MWCSHTNKASWRPPTIETVRKINHPPESLSPGRSVKVIDGGNDDHFIFDDDNEDDDCEDDVVNLLFI